MDRLNGSEAMDGGGGGGGTGGGGEERPRKMIKKGQWSPQEDQILTEYVRRYGEGNWNAVQRQTTLLRCGKSCRLRWANHLRPDLKKGAFSPEEESLVVRLHAEHGNKWAHMATLLPGRTDNEIKNFWNTRMKRHRRANLLAHPRKLRHAKTTASSPSYSYPSRTSGNAQPHPPLFRASSLQSSWPRPNECQFRHLPPQSNIAALCRDLSMISTECYPPSRAASVDLPLIQTKSLGAMVPGFCGGYGFFAMPSEECKSGMLGDLLVQAEKRKSESLDSNGAEAAASSFSMKPNKEPIDEIEYMYDDWSSLLASFASTMQVKTLALQEEEKKNESLLGNGAEAAASSSFSKEPNKEMIDEIECVDNDWSSLLANFASTMQAETLALKEEDKKDESLGGDGAKEAASSSSIGVEPNKEPIDEIECMDDDWISLLASFASTMQVETLTLKEEDKKKESLGGNGAEAAAFSSFIIGVKQNEELIDEIKCVDDDWSSLLATCASTVQAETLALMEEDKKNESLGCDGTEATTSSSFRSMEPNEKLIDELKCMGNDWSSLFTSFASTMQAETLALQDGEKHESLGSDNAKAATSFSLTKCVEPNKEPIDEIKFVDDDWPNLLAGFASKMQAETLALKKEEQKKNESLEGDGAEATSSSFSVKTNMELEPINETECVDDHLSSLLASFASTMQAETLTLKEHENKKNDSLGGNGAKTVASSSFSAKQTERWIDEIENMDEDLSSLLASFASTMPSPE